MGERKVPDCGPPTLTARSKGREGWDPGPHQQRELWAWSSPHSVPVFLRPGPGRAHTAACGSKSEQQELLHLRPETSAAPRTASCPSPMS